MTEESRQSLFPRNKPSIWRRLRWKLKDIWTFIKNIPANIKMICQWIPILWNNWDWDYNYLLNILQYKLSRMSKHIGEHDILVNSQKISKQIKMCVELIERIQEDDYTKTEEQAHKEKWGDIHYDSVLCDDSDINKKYGRCYRLDIYSPKARDLGLEEQERKEMMAMYDLARARKEKDYDILLRVMRKRIQYWWD